MDLEMLSGAKRGRQTTPNTLLAKPTRKKVSDTNPFSTFFFSASNSMSAPAAPTGERGGFGRGRGDRRGPRRGPRRGARKDEEKEWSVFSRSLSSKLCSCI